MDVFAAAVLALAGRAAGDGDLAAVVAVPGGDAVAPPELTGDAPVLDALHPVEVGLVVAGRDELDFAGADDVDGRVCQGLHLDEPLLRDAGLDNGAAAVAGADVVLHGLDADEVTLFLEVGHTGLAALFGGHADVLLRNVLVHAAVIGHDVDDRKVVAQTDFIVVGVVGRGDFDDTGPELGVCVFIAHQGDLLADEGQDEHLADLVLVAGVLRVDRDGGIAEHGLGTGGGELQVAGTVGEGIAQVPERTVFLFVFDFGVGDGRHAVGAPVDEALAAVDEVLLIEAVEDFDDGLGTAFVHGEPFPVPVAGGTEFLELFDDASAVLTTPVPGSFEERLAADVLFRDAFLFHRLHDLGFGGDGRVVGAGDPEGIEPFHPVIADEDVLQRIVKGVAHVELTRDVGGRDDDRVRFLRLVRFRVEVLVLLPEVVDLVFEL